MLELTQLLATIGILLEWRNSWFHIVLNKEETWYGPWPVDESCDIIDGQAFVYIRICTTRVTFPMCLFFFFINFKAGDFISSMGCWGASPIRFKLEINSSFFLKKNKTLKNYMKKELVVLPCTPHKRPQLKQAFSKTWAKDL